MRDPELVKTAARAQHGRIVVGINAKDGMAAVEGCGVAAIVVTDIGRDGLKTGVNVPFTAKLAHAVSIPVTASDGVRDLSDIRSLKASGAPIAGTIFGRALYDWDIEAAEGPAVVCDNNHRAANQWPCRHSILSLHRRRGPSLMRRVELLEPFAQHQARAQIV